MFRNFRLRVRASSHLFTPPCPTPPPKDCPPPWSWPLSQRQWEGALQTLCSARLCSRTLALKRTCGDWPEVLAQQARSLSQVPRLVSGSQDLSLVARSALPQIGGVWVPPGTWEELSKCSSMWNKAPPPARQKSSPSWRVSWAGVRLSSSSSTFHMLCFTSAVSPSVYFFHSFSMEGPCSLQ